jgi:hypothetical protein
MRRIAIVKFNHKRVGWLLTSLLTVVASGCQLQVVIEEGVLNNWFWSRFGWATLVTIVVGAAAAWRFCRLPIRAPLLDCIRTARLHFIRWIVVIVLLLTPLLLWFDAVMTQPFGEGSQLTASNVFFLVTLDRRMLLIMGCVALTFYLSVAFFTRVALGRTCNCKYAFLPKSRS